jgi:hypothetical protein
MIALAYSGRAGYTLPWTLALHVEITTDQNISRTMSCAPTFGSYSLHFSLTIQLFLPIEAQSRESPIPRIFSIVGAFRWPPALNHHIELKHFSLIPERRRHSLSGLQCDHWGASQLQRPAPKVASKMGHLIIEPFSKLGRPSTQPKGVLFIIYHLPSLLRLVVFMLTQPSTVTSLDYRPRRTTSHILSPHEALNP